MMHSSYEPVKTTEEYATPSSLNENLVGPARGEKLAPVAAQSLIQLTAPADLPEGYQFDANVGDRIIQVTVPPGGVEEGQTFSVPLPEKISSMINGQNVPVGHWRDGFWNLFSHGACHPHLWTACCCPLLAAGQVISRLKLTWCGHTGTTSQATGAYQIVFYITVVYWMIHSGMIVWKIVLDPNVVDDDLDNMDYQTPPPSFFLVAGLDNIIHYVFFALTVVIIQNARKQLRERYAIRGHEGEDCVVSCLFPCCTVAQMLRHTTDYETYPATCCTERGIPDYAPNIV